MTIELNGRTVELSPGATVADAVIEAGADRDSRGVAVAVDGQVIRRVDWGKTKLRRIAKHQPPSG